MTPPLARKRRGAQRTTIHDVAARAGVSTITVSRYFNEPTRVAPEATQRIAAAVSELAYVPNRVAGGLASARSKVAGFVVPNISGPIFAASLQALSDGLSAQGYQLLVASSYFSPEKEEAAVRAFLGWSPAALVLTSRFHSAGTERLIHQIDIPVIETWDLQAQRAPRQIGFSHRQVGQDAARHLIGRGHRRIAFVLNSAAGDHSAMERCEGYAQVMADHGLAPQRFTPTAEAPMEAGAEALTALMQQPQRPQALIFANDNLACGAILAGQRQGWTMPSDVAVFGFGDYAFADKLLPSLTTIRPPAQAIGERAAALILALTGGIASPGTEALPHVQSLECELIVRESA